MSISTDETVKKVIAAKLLSGNGSYAADPVTVSGELVNAQMLDSLDKMNRTAVNRSYRDIPANGFGQKVSRAFKRLMRRLTFWYVEPCMQQQTEYNSAVTTFSAHANSEINSLKCENNTLKTELEMLSGKMNMLIERGLEERMNEVSARLDARCNELSNDMSGRINRVEAQLSRSVDENMKILAHRVSSIDVSLRHMNAQNSSNGGTLFSGDENAFESFSQSGEDTIIKYILLGLGRKLHEISYLDLGANHAKYLSNTYAFYCQGAKGVLVEANPNLINELTVNRPEDIVLNRCISKTSGENITFYIMSGDGLSTMDYDAAVSFTKENSAISIEKTVTVETITVNDIINEYFKGKAPEILNVDIEGMELEVLSMIDFDTFRPAVIICEMIEYKSTFGIPEKNQEIIRFMEEHGYSEYAFTGINSIFVDRNALGGN